MFFFSVFFYSILGLSSFLDRPTALVEKKKFKERIKYAQVISTLSQNQPKAANLRQTKKESTNTKQPWGKKNTKQPWNYSDFVWLFEKKKSKKDGVLLQSQTRGRRLHYFYGSWQARERGAYQIWFPWRHLVLFLLLLFLFTVSCYFNSNLQPFSIWVSDLLILLIYFGRM